MNDNKQPAPVDDDAISKIKEWMDQFSQEDEATAYPDGPDWMIAIRTLLAALDAMTGKGKGLCNQNADLMVNLHDAKARIAELRAALESTPMLYSWDNIQSSPGCEWTPAKYKAWLDGPRAEALKDE